MYVILSFLNTLQAAGDIIAVIISLPHGAFKMNVRFCVPIE